MKTVLSFIARIFILVTAWLVGVLMATDAALSCVTPREDYDNDDQWNHEKDILRGDIARGMFEHK